MDLRTKLVFALVGVSLGSMLALGYFGYQEGRSMLEDSSLQKLQAVAESRKQDLQNVMGAWADRVALIGSRTQLRLTLEAYNATPRQADRARMNRILDDARASVASVDFLAVFDSGGQPVAVSWSDPTDRGEADLTLSADEVAAVGDSTTPTFLGLEVEGDGRRQVRYLAPLHSDQGERIGWLFVRMAASELIAISQDFTGLGELGETMVVERRPDQGVRVLHQVRHPGLVGGSWIPVRGDDVDPAAAAADGADGVFSVGVTDYRDEPVWAATRYLPDLRWGIVVKVDVAEEARPIFELRTRMVRLALSLSAFAILGGILLGLQLTRPVHELVSVANRIRAGETRARANVRAQDEVGVLARTFNRMADELTARDVSLSNGDQDDEVAEAVRERDRPGGEGGVFPSERVDGATDAD